MSIYINTNNGQVYSNCHITFVNGKVQQPVSEQDTDEQVMTVEEETSEKPETTDIWGKPRKGKYSEVRRYLEERKKGDPAFKEFCRTHSLRDICTYLSKQFGWFVDEHSLGANINRNR